MAITTIGHVGVDSIKDCGLGSLSKGSGKREIQKSEVANPEVT
jgi:hypothetical protein